MPSITIAPALKEKCPEMILAAIHSPIRILTEYEELKSVIGASTDYIAKHTERAEVSSIPSISDSRKAYKACGKDPSRYRLSAEALLRRITSGKDLYLINNVVDIINWTSMYTAYSIGGYDPSKIQGAIEFGIGQKDEVYQALGRGALNIEFLPVFRDELGAFGSPTSDSPRTCIAENSNELLMIIIDFGGKEEALNKAVQFAKNQLEDYALAAADQIKVEYIKA